MSVLKVGYASPSRVRAIYRYLLHSRGQKASRTSLAAVLTPDTLEDNVDKSTGDMIRAVLNEMIKMRLIADTGDELILHPDLPAKVKDREYGDVWLPYHIGKLLLSVEYEENFDFAQLLTWYLGQDLYEAPGEWVSFQTALKNQVGDKQLGCNDVNYGQFEDWTLFCQFTAKYLKKMLPNPVAYVRWILPELFGKQKILLIGDMITALGKACPVFETGLFRERLQTDFQHEQREDRYLSSVTSGVLLQLRDEGLIQLIMKSDANVFVLIEGEREHQISEISWLGREWGR